MAGKVDREKVTILTMIKMYCDRFHKTDGELCSDCLELSEYAMDCVSLCPYSENKPVCGRCPSNCFQKDSYARITAIMGYVGPRMLIRHPMLTVRHVIDAIGIRHHDS